jgi:hypothetical protein
LAVALLGRLLKKKNFFWCAIFIPVVYMYCIMVPRVPFLHYVVRLYGDIWHLGVNLAPRDELWHLQGIFTPSFTPNGWTLFSLEEWKGEQMVFTPRGQLRS